MADSSAYVLQGSVVATLQRAFHTGVMWVDLLVAVVAAALAGAVVAWLAVAPRAVLEWLRGAWRLATRRGVYVRTITLVAHDNGYVRLDHVASTEGAGEMVSAIKEYLHRRCGADFEAPLASVELLRDGHRVYLPAASYEIAVAPDVVLLYTTEVSSANEQSARSGGRASRSAFGGVGGGDGSESRGSSRVTKVELRTRRSPRLIDAFLDECEREYREHKARLQAKRRYYLPVKYIDKESRYLYETSSLAENRGCIDPSRDPAADSNGAALVAADAAAGRVAGRVAFEWIFLPERELLRTTLDEFARRRGRFGRPGLPHRLGLMLSGPPGCGKTSTLRELARVLDRSVVSVPLSRVHTNAQLRSLFLRDMRDYADGTGGVTVRYDRVIFVFEDVDAMGDLVCRRDLGGDGAHPLSRDLDRDGYDDDRRRKGVGSVPDGAAIAAAILAATSASDEAKTTRWLPPDDPLTLACLLELLDGIVEMPGRVVVFTTNHPERIDPALTRPGRIDLHIRLGPMRRADLAAMLEYHYGAGGGSDVAGRGVLGAAERDALPDGVLTAAEVERIVIGHTDLGDALAEIRTAALARSSRTL